jgi:hypothetical protein
MKAKEYNLITQCVETGVMLGWNRAHKHTDTPDPDISVGWYMRKHFGVE